MVLGSRHVIGVRGVCCGCGVVVALDVRDCSWRPLLCCSSCCVGCLWSFVLFVVCVAHVVRVRVFVSVVSVVFYAVGVSVVSGVLVVMVMVDSVVTSGCVVVVVGVLSIVRGVRIWYCVRVVIVVWLPALWLLSSVLPVLPVSYLLFVVVLPVVFVL